LKLKDYPAAFSLILSKSLSDSSARKQKEQKLVIFFSKKAEGAKACQILQQEGRRSKSLSDSSARRQKAQGKQMSSCEALSLNLNSVVRFFPSAKCLQKFVSG
jgi:hypothetical protein